MKYGHRNQVIIWLAIVWLLVLTIIVVGGITRLTHSGLSMVDWKPIMGILPPLSEAQWAETFNKYQSFPEYKLLNPNMDLSGFKKIFFWEYFHRMLGRLVGLVFIVPFLFFLVKGHFKQQPIFKIRLPALFILGGLQGLLGWYMVKSGLIDNPQVSHYRLAAHLFLAAFLLAALLWTIFELFYGEQGIRLSNRGAVFWHSLAITVLISLQIFYGALVAGLNAGSAYNTFPLMTGEIIPTGLFSMPSFVINLIDNPLTVQFIHRGIAWMLVLYIFLFWIKTFANRQTPFRNLGVHLLLGGIILQFILGVLTLLFQVPISLASLHQVGAMLLLCASIHVNYLFSHRFNY